MVTVAVASKNPVKVGAVEEAFRAMMPKAELEFIALDVESGVPDQPIGDEQTRLGAVTRAINASFIQTDANFCVGLEGGIATVDGQAYTFAWMAVLAQNQELATSRSVMLPLPASVMEKVNAGIELGHAIDEVFGTTNIKHKGGAFGIFTENRLTRQSVYVDTLVCALLPFTNPAFSVR
ncbi:inosine/xanthosine triphosphatase [Pseudovibrio exalbescens]|uniref:inosine/xanthosine triphosphatase n=1 Tax=Pseudovibrio exalbescens TaxID=197461 RepID=UPI002365BC6C|nr:inosine/xanthosine triphosphatase [Pseudovibrio exalbescens]MDD7908359.1 inosine/xanthosine triphosphatase [Pseudovibrio exalbescens]